VRRGLVTWTGRFGAGLVAFGSLVWLGSCGDSLHPAIEDAASPDAVPVDARFVPDGMPDLEFVSDEMVHSVLVDNGDFRDGDCEVVEGCVGAPGRRLLVRFATVSANRGTADMFVGVPPEAGLDDAMFEWSPCHKHHHVKDYASYELLDDHGVVLTARKQSFCLEDSHPVQSGIASSNYSCARQGITRGWADVYSPYLSCQWIDVTGLTPGSYTLRVVVNPHKKLAESNYDNNVFTVGVQF
jgi:hypothetical protein